MFLRDHRRINQPRQIAIFPEDRQAPTLACEVVQIRLSDLQLHRPRQWGACWLACHLWEQIACRAETAMANSLREHLARPDEARRLLTALYTTEADLLPDPEAGILTVRLHHSANAATDRVIAKLCEELNATETVFPRTNLRLVLKLGAG